MALHYKLQPSYWKRLRRGECPPPDFEHYFLMVSTTVVLGRFMATFTGINCPVLASLPILIDFPAIGIHLPFPGNFILACILVKALIKVPQRVCNHSSYEQSGTRYRTCGRPQGSPTLAAFFIATIILNILFIVKCVFLAIMLIMVDMKCNRFLRKGR